MIIKATDIRTTTPLQMTPTISELYLAFRQAKAAHFHEKRGVGLVEWATFESDLPNRLVALRAKLERNGGWFDDIELGQIQLTPKAMRKRLPSPGNSSDVTRIGGTQTSEDIEGLNVQPRCSPNPQFAIVEVLFLWRFGPLLDRLLSRDVIGYRLNIRRGLIRPSDRWLFEYWPRRYQEFRAAPLKAARRLLSADNGSAVVISADFASFYDTVDSSFLLAQDFVEQVPFDATSPTPSTREEYQLAVTSLLRAHEAYRGRVRELTRSTSRAGIPIGHITSRLVANLALASFDVAVARVKDLVCYRRYVDDFVIVGRSSPEERFSSEEAIERFIPFSTRIGDVQRIDSEKLRRTGSEFQLQPAKISVHHLSGEPGRDFIGAVTRDFKRLISERRAFIDPAVFLGNAARHLIRVSKDQGSPLRVLRDADRTRLERFALSTNLHSLGRVSSLVSRKEARLQVRETLGSVLRVLDDDPSWIDNIESVFLMLRVAVSSGDDASVRDIIDRTEKIWGTVKKLRVRVRSVYYRGERVESSQAWICLCDYLHDRRVEAICSTVALGIAESVAPSWLADGLTVRNRKVKWRALKKWARLLAAADLRAKDREDDDVAENPYDTRDPSWMQPLLASDGMLLSRLNTIGEFTQLSRELSGSWRIAPARLFLCTRPPSYLDVSRGLLAKVEDTGFDTRVFTNLLDVVNAIRGTFYNEPMGAIVDSHTVAIPASTLSAPHLHFANPRAILGNLVAPNEYWEGAVHRRPVLSLRRLDDLSTLLHKADLAARQRSLDNDPSPPSILVLPELSVPRAWFRSLANYVVRLNQHGLIVGVEYEHVHRRPIVRNQVYAVFPGPRKSAASWCWTKGFPAREERMHLGNVGLSFAEVSIRRARPPRTVVRSAFGNLSVLICSELLEAHRVADLMGRVELVLVPSWNTDASSYDHMIQSVGMHLHAVVAVANNGHYSDCRAWAPRETRWQRDLCRLIERDTNSVVSVEVPLDSLRRFRARAHATLRDGAQRSSWRPLPPDWTVT